MGEQVQHPANHGKRLRLVRATYWFTKHWLSLFVVIFGLYNLLPFTAPMMMRLGWYSLGSVIYDLYGTQCHQMAQRSFFLFGERLMYNLNELPLTLTGNSLNDTLALRGFRGSDTLGWKVAWSDRMVYMYGSLWAVSGIYWLLSRYQLRKPIRIWIFIVLLMPLALDGLTHLLSDTNGLAAGFRYDNRWLAAVTNNSFPASFYQGDALGSFNSMMRFITGVLFAVGTGGLLLPLLDQEMRRSQAVLKHKLTRYQARIGSALEVAL
jgi:uncharacterized membrane protein